MTPKPRVRRRRAGRAVRDFIQAGVSSRKEGGTIPPVAEFVQEDDPKGVTGPDGLLALGHYRQSVCEPLTPHQTRGLRSGLSSLGRSRVT